MDRQTIAAIGTVVSLAMTSIQATAAQTPQPCGTEDGTGCAPVEARVDLDPPTFSDPLTVTNPLHPSSSLRSGLLLGHEDGIPLRVEITLLPEPHVVQLDGQAVPALELQYVAFLDGRIAEVALDWYAQADDGAVWYLGEDVFNYEDGVLADTEGTWEAGKGAPPAMIMPADPQVGDVYRPENAPGVVFEEVTVARTGLTVDGPSGPVSGAIEVDELHMEGTHESKIFAPGYGEFSTGSGTDVEALALGIPIDALGGPVPAELTAIAEAAGAAGSAAASEDWPAATEAVDRIRAAWESYRAGQVPPLLESAMTDAIDGLATAVERTRPGRARTDAIGVARLGLDLELRHRDPTSVDRDRFALWLDQLALDLERGDQPAILSDVTALEWTRDRFAHTLDAADLDAVEAALDDLRAAVDDGDHAAATTLRDQLEAAIGSLAE